MGNSKEELEDDLKDDLKDDIDIYIEHQMSFTLQIGLVAVSIIAIIAIIFAYIR